MLKRLASLGLFLSLTTSVYSQEPEDAEAASTLMSRAIMTGEQVMEILDETVDWYRMLGIQQQSATQPSDLLILYANGKTADGVVRLAFEIGRANAELLSSQAEMEQADAPETATSPQALQASQRALDDRRTAIQAEIAATQRQVAAAEGTEREALQEKVAELQSELDVVNARRNLLNNMVELAHETDANGSGVNALREHINAIAASIPAAASEAMPDAGLVETPGVAAAAGNAAPVSGSEQVAPRRFGLWDLGVEVLRLQGKLSMIEEVDRRTEALQQTFMRIRTMPEQRIEELSARGDALGARSSGGDAADLKAARDEYDTIAWLFAQTSSILVPLTKAGVLLEQYRNNLDSWRDSARSQLRSALKTLAARAALLLLILGAVFGAGELWKRAVFNYVQEPRRRHQLMLVRRIVLWAVALVIVGIAFATEASSFATFAGLLTAGIAVAMQSVLVSIVGYFFLVGKYGLRVGDRVQIANVMGEVIDLGIVRLHMMELGPRDGPTGRVVAFANSVVFQAAGGIFKQIPGVNLSWREISLAIPVDGDYAAIKQRLLDAAHGVLEDYRDDLERQTRELQKTSSWSVAEKAQPQVQLRFSAGSIDAIVRYPVPLQRAAEVEERMSRALLDALRQSAAAPPQLASQPT
jgi:small-conductance mechanosensitive channel